MTNLIIPNSVINIWSSAFSNNKLINVTISDSATSIWIYAFDHNELTSLVIPNSVTDIWYYAFANNQLLESSITIKCPLPLPNFGTNVFYNNLPNQTTNIENPTTCTY